MAHFNYLDSGLDGWVKKYAWRMRWRLPHWYSVDDLIQDGYLCFQKVLRHPQYQGLARKRRATADSQRIFMHLFKTTFTRHVHDVSKAKTAEYAVSSLLGMNDEHDEWIARNGASESPTAEFEAILKQAPKDMKRLLETLQSKPPKELPDYLTWKVGKLRRRETTEEYVCRLAGFNMGRYDRHRQTVNEYVCGLVGFDPKRVDIPETLVVHFDLQGTRKKRV